MTKEASAILEIFGQADQTDFDAAYAELMATERGRSFLTEYARRNRNADTELVMGALSRVETAVRGEPAPGPALSFSEIAAEIEAIQARLEGDKTVQELSAVLERMQDLAFTLQEQTVAQSMRDEFAASLQQLSGGLTGPTGLFVQFRELVVELGVLVERLRGAAAQTPKREILTFFGPAAAEQRGAGLLNKAFDSETFARTVAGESNVEFAPTPPPAIDYASPVNGVAVSEQLMSMEIYPSENFVGPQEDPEGLFEPMPMPSPIAEMRVDTEMAAEKNSSQTADIISAATHPDEPVDGVDPLAVLRDLTDEERIALFT